MDITLDKKNSSEGLIKVSLKEDDYQPKVEEKVKDYAKKANIKGFRPGKVPTGMIKKMYGKSIKVEEINSLLSQSITSYIRENKLDIIGEPLPNVEKTKSIDWDNDQDFDFEYEVGLVDDFKYDVSSKQKVTSYKIELDKKGLDETIENVRKQFGQVTNPDVSQEGDAFYGTAKAVESEISNEATLKWQDLSKSGQKALKKVKPEDTVALDIEKDIEDHHILQTLLDVGHDKAASMKGKLEFTIKNINRTEPAEINQELFDKVFGPESVKTEEEFYEKVKSTVEENYSRETEQFLDHTIRNHFTEKTKIEISEPFLKRWLLISNEGKVTEADVDREIDEYIKSLKWDLIRNKIAEENEIKVENEEVVDKAKLMILQQLGGPGAAEQLKDHLDSFAENYLKGENGQNYMKLFNEVRDGKIMDFVKSSISISEKKIDLDKFKKVVEEQR